MFLGGNHRVDWTTTYPFGHILVHELGGQGIQGHPAKRGDVVIGDDVWIGYGATIMSEVTIGAGAVVGVNATVVKDAAPYEIGAQPGAPHQVPLRGSRSGPAPDAALVGVGRRGHPPDQRGSVQASDGRADRRTDPTIPWMTVTGERGHVADPGAVAP